MQSDIAKCHAFKLQIKLNISYDTVFTTKLKYTSLTCARL